MLPISMRHSSSSYVSLLRHYLRPHWIAMVLLAGLLFGDIGLQLLAPQIVRTFIDTVTAGGAIAQLLGLAATVLGGIVGPQPRDAAFVDWRGIEARI